jgi:membrane-associated phospholipid phosphatase
MLKIFQPLPIIGFVLCFGLTTGISSGQANNATSEKIAEQSTREPGSHNDSSTAADPSGSAQSPSTDGSTPQPQPKAPVSSPSAFREFVGTFLSDEKAIWTSPLHAKTKDLYWLLPLAATTGALLATDTDISNALPNTQHQIDVSRGISEIGSAYTLYGVSGAFYLIGRLKDNDRLRETGWLGIMAITHSSIVVEALKLAAGRERPEDNSGQGRFWKGKSGFPSGHAISSWSLASVVAKEYDDNRLIQIGAYSLATMVSVSRVTGRRHFPSDVVVGSAMGFLIGRYMVRAHQGTSDFTGRSKLRTLLSPQAAPSFDGRSKTCGIGLNWYF